MNYRSMTMDNNGFLYFQIGENLWERLNLCISSIEKPLDGDNFEIELHGHIKSIKQIENSAQPEPDWENLILNGVDKIDK